jgi:hypothetical protein
LDLLPPLSPEPALRQPGSGRGISSMASTDGGPNLLKRKAFTFQLFVGKKPYLYA